MSLSLPVIIEASRGPLPTGMPVCERGSLGILLDPLNWHVHMPRSAVPMSCGQQNLLCTVQCCSRAAALHPESTALAAAVQHLKHLRVQFKSQAQQRLGHYPNPIRQQNLLLIFTLSNVRL